MSQPDHGMAMVNYSLDGPRAETEKLTTIRHYQRMLGISTHYAARTAANLVGVCLPNQALLTTIFVLGSYIFTSGQSSLEFSGRLIGPTATVTEVSTGLPFRSRVDTGATTSSIHCVAMLIEDPRPIASNNIGKTIHFQIANSDGETQWIESMIADYVTVQTSDAEEDRYKVPIKLRWKDVEKDVLVTLNDRSKMGFPLLLGRNFLRDDFIVQVALDTEE